MWKKIFCIYKLDIERCSVLDTMFFNTTEQNVTREC